jgi:hypothetical protein
MQSFNCTRCRRVTYFENSLCLGCGAALGFDPDALTIKALEATPDDATLLAEIGAGNAGRSFRRCSNADHGACNWLVAAEEPAGLCRACALNRTIPDLSDPGHLAAWREVESAKKRLVYSLIRFGLPIEGCPPDVAPLTFDVVPNAQTGHLDGVITIDVAEADAIERERRREHFDELYRTVLGHLRHEAAHYYWPIVVERTGLIEPFRALFGDERADYGEALARHHANGPPSDWPSTFVSAYATAHPWEDWAETWAHYLHIVDTVDTAEATGLEPRAKGLVLGSAWPFGRIDIYRNMSLEELMERWFPLTTALNELTRSMGHRDFYPFVTPAAVIPKFEFVHRAIRTAVNSATRDLPVTIEP